MRCPHFPYCGIIVFKHHAIRPCQPVQGIIDGLVEELSAVDLDVLHSLFSRDALVRDQQGDGIPAALGEVLQIRAVRSFLAAARCIWNIPPDSSARFIREIP